MAFRDGVPALQNKRASDQEVPGLWATDKHVVISAAATRSDASALQSPRRQIRHAVRARAEPPDLERNPVWPYGRRAFPLSSHEEGVNRDWSIRDQEFIGENGRQGSQTVKAAWKDASPPRFRLRGRHSRERVLLAMGFVSPLQSMLDEFGVQKDSTRQRQRADDGEAPTPPRAEVSPDRRGRVRRGHPWVWAIREGRHARGRRRIPHGFSDCRAERGARRRTRAMLPT